MATPREKIMVVDDDPNLRKTLSDILRIKGYDIVTAGTGTEAIAAVGREKFSVALIDLVLPDMQGIQVMTRIKSISPQTEAIILTGHASMDSAIEATKQGAFSYVLKPYGIEDLLQNIGHAGERKWQQERIREGADKFRAVVEQNVVGIAIISQEGTFLYANPFFSATLGCTPHELIGKNVEGIVVDTDRERVAEFHRSFPYGSPAVLQISGTVVTKEGRKIDIFANESGITYEGKPAALAVVIDVSERKKSEEALRRALQGTISAIVSTIEMRDPFTGGHQRRVAALSAAIAREMALSEHAIGGINLAASVHDIGKVIIPVELLSYPGKLTPNQFALIQEHARAGYEILKDIEFPWPVATVVLQHHERLDGSGYPQGLKGEAILPEAKIFAVADVVEAMLSHRPYRPALGLDVALNEIEKGKGRLYDPAAVEACIRLLREKRFLFADKAVA